MCAMWGFGHVPCALLAGTRRKTCCLLHRCTIGLGACVVWPRHLSFCSHDLLPRLSRMPATGTGTIFPLATLIGFHLNLRETVRQIPALTKSSSSARTNTTVVKPSQNYQQQESQVWIKACLVWLQYMHHAGGAATNRDMLLVGHLTLHSPNWSK